MSNIEIIMKLNGEIRPIGETNTDSKRFENLQNLCALTESLLIEISKVSRDFKDKHEFSMKRAGNLAAIFMESLKNY